MERIKKTPKKRRTTQPEAVKEEKRQKERKASKLEHKFKKAIFVKDSDTKENYRRLPKDIIKRISGENSASAVYPVLCMLSDFEKKEEVHISKEILCEYTGLCWRAVSKGLETLKNLKVITLRKVKGEYDFWLYEVEFYRKHQQQKEELKNSIEFNTFIIESRRKFWAKLSSKEKQLYLALRCRSNFDFDPQVGNDYLKGRKTHVIESWLGRISNLCKDFSINPANVNRNLKHLEEQNLISILRNNKSTTILEIYLIPKNLLLEPETNGKIDNNAEKIVADNAEKFLELAKKLAFIILDNKKVKHSNQELKQWANDIKLLNQNNKVEINRIEDALEWYDDNIGGEYIPAIESGYSLRNKFTKLENAIEREFKQTNPNLSKGRMSKRSELDYSKLVGRVVVGKSLSGSNNQKHGK